MAERRPVETHSGAAREQERPLVPRSFFPLPVLLSEAVTDRGVGDRMTQAQAGRTDGPAGLGNTAESRAQCSDEIPWDVLVQEQETMVRQ